MKQDYRRMLRDVDAQQAKIDLDQATCDRSAVLAQAMAARGEESFHDEFAAWIVYVPSIRGGVSVSRLRHERGLLLKRHLGQCGT
jgi:hypothetical protein